VFGLAILPYLLLQAVVGIMLLEIVNYLEHYGMLRQKEHTGPATSGSGRATRWNSNNIATNVLLYHLQRHSDHHANPTRRYQACGTSRSARAADRLRGDDRAGTVPAAVVPDMDPRVLAHFDGDMSRANIQPSKRNKVLARYPVPETA
jgi:alkane 1-monooxygenase